MKVVYYYSVSLKISPVKAFLGRYALSAHDSEKQKEHKVKVLTFIDQTITFVSERNGRPIPPVSQPLRGDLFCEMRIKDSSNLIRILYFCYRQSTLVLLYAFEKPDHYEKGKKKKVEKDIRLALERSYINYQDFLKYQYYEAY